MNRLEHIAQQIGDKKQPPVHLWEPDHKGVIDIRIDRQGNWFHEGGPITRDALVALFASILWAENGQHYLVTPAEKLQIVVEDVPYIVTQAELADEAWVVTTNTHESVIISESNPVELRRYKDQWVPYVRVRYDIWARVNRSIYYQWAELAIEQQAVQSGALILHSQGYDFEVAKL